MKNLIHILELHGMQWRLNGDQLQALAIYDDGAAEWQDVGSSYRDVYIWLGY